MDRAGTDASQADEPRAMEEQHPGAWHYHSPPACGVRASRSPPGRREGLEGKPPQRKSQAMVPTPSGQQLDYGAQSHQQRGVGSLQAAPARGRSRCGQDVGSPCSRRWQAPACTLPPGHGPLTPRAGCRGQTASVPLPLPGRKMWEPRAAASPLPQTCSLLIKPLSICRRLHGSSPSALAQRWRYRRVD